MGVCTWSADSHMLSALKYPFDKVLKLSFTSEVTVINDGLDLILFSIFDKVRRWPCVIGPMFGRFVIRGQE